MGVGGLTLEKGRFVGSVIVVVWCFIHCAESDYWKKGDDGKMNIQLIEECLCVFGDQ